MGGNQVWTATVVPTHTVLQWADIPTNTTVDTGIIPTSTMAMEYKVRFSNGSPSRGNAQSKNISILASPKNLLTISFYSCWTTSSCYLTFSHFGKTGYYYTQSELLRTNSTYTWYVGPDKAKNNTSDVTYSGSSTTSVETTTMKIAPSNSGVPHRFYGFKMWDGDTLILDLIPVLLDNVVKFYDTVTGTYIAPNRAITSYA